jgi:uncharacterized damage-inducible protein DinB
MSPTSRTKPPLVGPEGDLLVGFLDYHRDTLRQKTEGIDAEQLGRPLAPSTMTLGGLLKHLAYVEDWWFGQVFAGNPAPEPWASAPWQQDDDWEWHSAAQDSPEQLRELLDTSIAVSDRILTQALARPEGLDALSSLGSHRSPSRKFSLRWVLLHLIEEYARHNGHADLIRESVDGQVGH